MHVAALACELRPMSQIAGAVMMTLLLVVLGATFGGIELARGGGADVEPSVRAALLLPAMALWLVALLALTGIGVIAAILATRRRPDAIEARGKPRSEAVASVRPSAP